MNDYVSKPINVASLLAKLANLPARSDKRATANPPRHAQPASPIDTPAKVKPSCEVQLAGAIPGGEKKGKPGKSDGAIDEEKLDELKKYLPLSNIVDLIALFNNESRNHVQSIRAWLAAGDYVNIARQAHNLVSTAGNIGAMRLSATARLVEIACKNSDPGKIDILVGEMERGVSAAGADFAAWIAAHTDGGQSATG
jgi:HPt (histidine-containing phosphotransfer) domain-containing protein